MALWVSNLLHFWYLTTKFRENMRSWFIKILTGITVLPYSDKRKQLLKMKFFINEQNVSVMYSDINAISWCLDWNIFTQDECFCSKLGLEVEHAKPNLKISLFQIWVICHLLPFVRVGYWQMGIFWYLYCKNRCLLFLFPVGCIIRCLRKLVNPIISWEPKGH